MSAPLMPRLHVGLSALQGNIDKYRKRYDLLEVSFDDTTKPRMDTLLKWRKAVPPGFIFSVVLPREVSNFVQGAAFDNALAMSLQVAATLQARCILLRTPPSFRPTKSNRNKLAQLFERVPPEGVIRCWEATGIWEWEDAVATSRDMGTIAVLDAAQDVLPPGPVTYTRLRALGSVASMSIQTIERIAERLRGRRESFVVVEGKGGLKVRRALEAAILRRGAPVAAPSVIKSLVSATLVAEDEEQ